MGCAGIEELKPTSTVKVAEVDEDYVASQADLDEVEQRVRSDSQTLNVHRTFMRALTTHAVDRCPAGGLCAHRHQQGRAALPGRNARRDPLQPGVFQQDGGGVTGGGASPHCLPKSPRARLRPPPHRDVNLLLFAIAVIRRSSSWSKWTSTRTSGSLARSGRLPHPPHMWHIGGGGGDAALACGRCWRTARCRR